MRNNQQAVPAGAPAPGNPSTTPATADWYSWFRLAVEAKSPGHGDEAVAIVREFADSEFTSNVANLYEPLWRLESRRPELVTRLHAAEDAARAVVPVIQNEPPQAIKTPAWEAEFAEGWHTGYKADIRDGVSKTNVPYTLFIFTVADGERRGRFSYYLGNHRADEIKALKLRLAENPYCRIKLTRKDGVKGLVISEVDTVTKVDPQ